VTNFLKIVYLPLSQYTCGSILTCHTLAPYFAGFNVDACDIYGGTWCPNPQDCSSLKTCVATAIDEAEDDFTETVAYRNYLEAAPPIFDSTDIEACGDARAYFGFDPASQNDVKICNDVKQLRFNRNFAILNNFAKGGNGDSNNGLVELTELTKPAIRK
jgi:hypothetical protein